MKPTPRKGSEKFAYFVTSILYSPHVTVILNLRATVQLRNVMLAIDRFTVSNVYTAKKEDLGLELAKFVYYVISLPPSDHTAIVNIRSIPCIGSTGMHVHDILEFEFDSSIYSYLPFTSRRKKFAMFKQLSLTEPPH